MDNPKMCQKCLDESTFARRHIVLIPEDKCPCSATNMKATKEKLDYSLLPIYPQQEAVRAFMDGIKSGKYKAWDWLDNPYPYSKYFNKIRRHLDAWKDYEDRAKDSGVHHIGHLIADAMILLEWIHRGVGIDDRRRPSNSKGSDR